MDERSAECVYEQDQESPNSLGNLVGEYARVSKKAVRLTCSPVRIEQID